MDIEVADSSSRTANLFEQPLPPGHGVAGILHFR